jgi:hypothetical protein
LAEEATDKIIAVVHATPQRRSHGKAETGPFVQFLDGKKARDGRGITRVTPVAAAGFCDGGIELHLRNHNLETGHDRILIESGHARRVGKGGISPEGVGGIRHPGRTQTAGGTDL